MIRTPLLCLAIASTLVAQGPGWRLNRGRGWRQQGPVLTQLHQIRVERIQQALGIPEDRARAMADRWQAFDRDYMERHRQMRRVKLQVGDILVAPGSDTEKDARLRPILQQYLALRRQQHEQRQAFEGELMHGLTPLQQGRLVLLMDDLQRSLREALVDLRAGD